MKKKIKVIKKEIKLPEPKKVSTKQIGVCFHTRSPELRALKRAVMMEEESMSGWCRKAILEKLERDGWLVEGKIPRGKFVG